MRYDTAIIGAGAEGLAAAALLSQAGLRVLVIERNERTGGRSVTREFYPGFRASPFVDELASIPPELYWALDLARHGAVFVPPRSSLAVWPDRHHHLDLHAGAVELLAVSARRREEIVARVFRDASRPQSRSLFRKPHDEPWPGADWAFGALGDIVAEKIAGTDAVAHITALTLGGSVADPAIAGSALHLLGAGASAGRLAGGLSRLGASLFAAAKAAGAEFSLDLEATDIRHDGGRILGVGLADGSEIAAGSVVSTLDLKRTFLTFFPWNALPGPIMRRVNVFRMAGGTARVLFALDQPPKFGSLDTRGAAIHIAPNLEQMSEVYHAWRSGVVAESLPTTLRVVSDGDPDMAPASSAVVTATLNGVPFRLFDGAWTHDKRELLRRRALEAAETVSPGFAARVVASEVIAPPDIEDALGATEGDLAGGEIAGDQVLVPGPFDAPAMPRTPIAGFYLAGSYLTAGAFATCAAGAAAARALLADRAQGRIK